MYYLTVSVGWDLAVAQQDALALATPSPFQGFAGKGQPSSSCTRLLLAPSARVVSSSEAVDQRPPFLSIQIS